MTLVASRNVNSYVTMIKHAIDSFCLAGAVFGEVGG